MLSFLKLTWIEIKLFFRLPIMAFFTLVFPLMLLFLFGSIYGNAPSPLYGGYGSVDISIPAYTAMIIGTSALLSLTINLALYRERGVLRRFRATPVSPAAVLGAQLAMLYLMTLVGMALMMAAGALVYHVRFEGNLLAVLAGFTLSCLSFFSFGLILAGTLPNIRMANILGMVLLYPMIFLSGATIPMEVLPQAIRDLAPFLPMTHVVTLLQGLWKGEAFAAHLPELAVLGGMTVVCSLIAVRFFRWE